jgi:hypothetical protein
MFPLDEDAAFEPSAQIYQPPRRTSATLAA